MNASVDCSNRLTRYRSGSTQELWAISWPLMLGLLSASLMMFVNRLILGRYSSDALNAGASAGMMFWTCAIIPLICASITEVLVGHSNGSKSFRKVGPYIWQMLWLSAASVPLFLLGAWLAPYILFAGSYNSVLETAYFRSFMILGPFFCTTVALTGFFVGLGFVRIVTLSTILGNLINIILDFVLIFGYGPCAPLGIHGAALATGISQIVQTIIMLSLFLSYKNRTVYNTTDYTLRWNYMKELLTIGFPAALGKFLETLAHCIFFRIALNTGADNFTIISVTQSFYLLLSFIVEGLSKGVSSITANMLGAADYQQVRNVIKAGLKIHTFVAICTAGIIIVFFPELFALFFDANDMHILNNSCLMATARNAFYMLGIFFLVDGFGWIYIGALTAAGDTKFLLRASVVLTILAYIIPTCVILGVFKASADKGWAMVVVYACITLGVYSFRFRSNRWLENFKLYQLKS